MTDIENPSKVPLNAKDISFEPLENTQETKTDTETMKALDKKERLFEEQSYEIPVEEQERIKEINAQLRSERVAEINSIPLRKPLGDEKWNGSTQYTTSTPSTKKTFFSGLKQFGIAIGLLGAATATEAKGVEKNPGDSTEGKNKIENVRSSENTMEVGIKLRQDWNDYVDWLATVGMKGNPALDKNDLGGAMIDRYRKEHPGTTVSRETVDDIQREFASYREWVLSEVKAGRAQLSPGTTEETFMKRLSVVDNIAGQYTTQHKFPDAYLKTFVNGKLTEVKNLGFAKIKDDTVAYPTDIAGNK